MRTQIRAGFTLIELMVAMALTLFVMVILSQAFVLSLETFAGMKGLGDMQINLRVATNLLRDDLSQDHFEGKRRLSDVDAAGNPLIFQQPPQAGFFAVVQHSAASNTVGAPYFIEGFDTNGLPSYRAIDHVLYMTVKRRGNRQENFFTTSMTTTAGPPTSTAATFTQFFGQNTAYDVIPGNLTNDTLTLPYAAGSTTAFYSSQWAEVIYYLVRIGSTEEPNNPNSNLGTPTFGLYRAQWVMVPDGTNISGKFAAGLEASPTFGGLSCLKSTANPAFIDFYSPADAAMANPGGTPLVKRVIPTPGQPFDAPASARLSLQQALVLPSVISFQVQIMRTGATAFADVPNQLYDTAMFNTPNADNFGLKAIQITLRVWDNKTRQTRQVTVVQDL